MSSLKTQPILTLRRIDPTKVLNDYQSGKYAELPKELHPKIKHTHSSSMVSETSEESKTLVISTFRDKNNVTIQLIAATPHQGSNRICSWCGLPYQSQASSSSTETKHDPGTLQGLNIGIPVAFEIREDAQGNQRYIYTVVGWYNSFECAYADLKRNSGRGVLFRNAQFQDSESLLRMLAYSATGSTEIKEALPREFLSINGGSMSPSEYFKDLHTYTHIPHVVVLQGSTQYFRI